MNKTFSIKDVRKSKNISLEYISRKLKLNISIIKDIEDGTPLKGNFAFYENAYKNAIFKILKIPIKKTINLTNGFENNHQLLLIIYFTIFFIFGILTLSSYILNNFSKNVEINFSNKDYKNDLIVQEFKKKTINLEINFLNHNEFINNFKYTYNDFGPYFLKISSKPNRSSYYKIYLKDEKEEKFGKISSNTELILSDAKAVISITDVSSIDYIVYNSKKYIFSFDSRYYLDSFDIAMLNKLK